MYSIPDCIWKRILHFMIFTFPQKNFFDCEASFVVESRAPKGARMSGDVILGGLFPVHEKSER